MKTDPSLVSDLWFFRVAAESLSFVKAAGVLSVTQSAVSQRIQRLEGRLGTKLFHRQKVGLKLTGHGELMLDAVRGAFDSIESAVSAVATSKTPRPVTISCVPSLALEWLTPRLVEFYKFRPDIAVSLIAEIDSAEGGRVSPDSFDIAIRYGPTPPDFGEVLFEHAEDVFPVLSPALGQQLSAAADTPVTFLHDAMPWANPRSPTVEWDYWLDRYGSPVRRRSRDVFVNLVQLCYHAAMDGLGVAMGRKLVVRRHLRRGTLVALVGEPPISDLKYFIVGWPRQERRDVSTVVAWLQAQMFEDLKAHPLA